MKSEFGNWHMLPEMLGIVKMASYSSYNHMLIEHEIIFLLSQLVALVVSLLSTVNKHNNMMLMEFRAQHVRMNHQLSFLETKLNRLKVSMNDIKIHNIFLVTLSFDVIDYGEMYNFSHIGACGVGPGDVHWLPKE